MKLSDYHYDLPDAAIANHPLAQRDQAKLLHYKDGNITHKVFTDVPDLLPEDSLVVFNNTKVIPARLFLQRATGARIELLLLHPIEPVEVSQSMKSYEPVQWECMIGNKKKWKDGEVISNEIMSHGSLVHGENGDEVVIYAKLVDREKQIVEISWSSDQDFATVIEEAGKLPLPPYLNRNAEDDDYERYQTVYAKAKGAVAAPTAGLHFTDAVLEGLAARGIGREYVTLHVGAGTFQPVKEDDPRAHHMHVEQISLERSNVERLLAHPGKIIAVGTTSMRVLESVYWFGVEAHENPDLPADHTFFLDQDRPYEQSNNRTFGHSSSRGCHSEGSRGENNQITEQPSNQAFEGESDEIDIRTALQALLDYFDRHSLQTITAETGIYILPGYSFKLVDGIFTNFHLPGTTLMLLVAAFIGEDWRSVYDRALAEDYRFLSYGDSSLLWRG